MKRTAVLLFALTVSGVAAAAVYKWTDADGKVHYSNMPPPTGTKVKQPPAQLKGGTVSSIAGPKPVQAEEKKNGAAVPASAPAAQPPSEKDPQACAQARARKTFLESGQLTKSVNEKGEVEFMGTEKRQAELAEAEKAIERFCP
ncbi:protein of unknown function [Formivibrio citricus]|uniref:DUF4124 domain-containing protein n=1 Tax=Formivibrio citricus TaxID=83765 RepID=A0A1I4Y673_9NEIS|nr:DUF4124 domain-containing protein [Formivibrio citricus]SFN33020.1 protein of unknown function [Formivibrio citricus]